jgi:Na+/proline symporter
MVPSFYQTVDTGIISLIKPAPCFNPAIPFAEPPLGIPSFWWGCIIGVWGIAVVYFVTEDKEETKQALKGCIIGTLVWVVLYFGFYVWILGNAGWF